MKRFTIDIRESFNRTEVWFLSSGLVYLFFSLLIFYLTFIGETRFLYYGNDYYNSDLIHSKTTFLVFFNKDIYLYLVLINFLLAYVYFLIYISKKQLYNQLYKPLSIAHFIGTVQFQFIILISIAYQYSRPGGPRHYFTGPDGGNSFKYEKTFHLTDLLVCSLLIFLSFQILLVINIIVALIRKSKLKDFPQK